MKTACFVLMAGLLAAGNVFAANKHECGYCHVTSDKTAGMPLNAPLTELCLSCHPDRSGANEHIVDITPSMKVVGLPLSKDGTITCTTCHDPHEKSGYPKLLRAKPSELCQKCHLK
jgi:predicted CXXCH cytochrome family protein